METPELDKMLAVKEKSQTISQFIDWLHSLGCEICQYIDETEVLEGEEKPGYYLINQTTERMLAKHFGIDLEKCEQERRALEEELRKQNS